MSANSLALQVVPFIGRGAELNEIAALLANPACRMLTLVGPGGIGKTRLALEAAQHWTGIVHVVLFQALTSPDFMVSGIADALGIQFSAGIDPKQQLLDYCQDKAILMVLDNLEHLLDGVSLFSEILAAAPDMRLLITSRERLNLREEWVLDVGGLGYPLNETEAKIEDYDAVRLFVQHTQRIKASFILNDESKPAVIRICRMVDGMPLGIELAAAWVRVLSCEAIADEIAHSLDILETSARNVEPRHRSMQAAFEPTWKRLTEAERDVFKKLSAFRGGFTHEAAKQVAGASLRVLSSLADKSLLRMDANERCDIHELLRQYGEAQLTVLRDSSDYAHDMHSAYYTSFLAYCWPRLTGREIKPALHEINVELENIRTAWNWAVSHHKTQEIEAALDSLWFFYDQGSRYHEGEQLFAKTVNELKVSAPEQEALRAKVLARHGAICRMALLRDPSIMLLEESVSLLRQSGAQADLAFALARLSAVTPEVSRREQCLEESLAIYTDLSDRWGIAEASNWLCMVHIEKGFKHGDHESFVRAQRYAEEELTACQQLDSLYGIARAWLNLGQSTYCLEEYEQARQYFEKSLNIFQNIDIFWGIPTSLWHLTNCACALGNYADARRFARQGLEMAYDPRVISYLQFTYPFLIGVACIWLGEHNTASAYELLALADQWCQKVGYSRDFIEFRPLVLLDDEVSPDLAAAITRGRARDLDDMLKEVLNDLIRHEHPSESTSQTANHSLDEPLSGRELEILRLTADGLNSREVAERLVLSVGTIRWHLKNIYNKLDAHSRSEAIARAREFNLLT